MPKIVWFRFNNAHKRGKTRPAERHTEPRSRLGLIDVSLAGVLCVIVLMLFVLPSKPGEGINPVISPGPSERPAAIKAQPTATPSADKGVVIIQEVLKDTPNAQICVPRVEGLQNEGAQKAFNELMYRESGAQSLLELAVQREGDPAASMWEASLQYAAEQIGRVLHISTFAYTYTGGAHGAEARNEFYLDPVTGSIYTLNDMFKDDSGAQEAILGYIRAAMQTAPDVFFADADPSPLPTTFRIRQDGLEIYYPPYAIAPYAEGFPAFLVPWSTVNPYIDHDGAFIKALNAR